jgi:hypothetical protein
MKLLLMRVGFSLIWAAAGLYLAGASRKAFELLMRWRRVGIVTEGVIVDFEADKGSMTGSRDWIPFLKPVVTFKTKEGVEGRFTSGMGSRPNPYTVGQRLPIRYLSDEPNLAELEAAAMAWWPVAALVFACVVCLAIAALPFLLAPPAPR